MIQVIKHLRKGEQGVLNQLNKTTDTENICVVQLLTM